jgi:hypothetical protein
MAKSFKTNTTNFNGIRGLADLQVALRDETRKATKRRASGRKANRASQVSRGIDPDKGKTDRSIHQDPRGYVGAAPAKAKARVVVKAPTEESNARIKSLAVDAARGKQGARSKLERAVVALPKGRQVGAAVDAAREQVRDERAEAREIAKHTRHAAKKQKLADEALRKAQTESAYHEVGKVSRGERHKALYKAYFAHRTAEAVKTPGVYAWDLPRNSEGFRFDKPTAGMLAHDASKIGKLLYNCECWAR